MAKVNYAALSRVTVRDAAEIFTPRATPAAIASDLAIEAMRVLHDGLSSPSDRIRSISAMALINAHCKLATASGGAAVPESPQLSAQERVAALTQALANPTAELRAAMQAAGLVAIVDQRGNLCE